MNRMTTSATVPAKIRNAVPDKIRMVREAQQRSASEVNAVIIPLAPREMFKSVRGNSIVDRGLANDFDRFEIGVPNFVYNAQAHFLDNTLDNDRHAPEHKSLADPIRKETDYDNSEVPKH